MLTALGLIAFGYLLGSIPTGYWVGKLKGIDIREVGSGSTGATNVARNVGKAAGVFVLVADVLKGYFPVWLAIFLQKARMMENVPYSDWMIVPVIVAAMTLIGHSKSIVLNFKGGKSAATALGNVIAMQPVAAAIAFAVFVLMGLATRIISIASMTAAIVSVVAVATVTYPYKAPLPYVIYIAMGASYVIWRHKDNIGRIMRGEEKRLFSSLIPFIITTLLVSQSAAWSKPAATAPSNNAGISADEAINIRVYKATNQGVVNISTSSQVQSDFFFAPIPREGFGSGVIISPEGYILTNNHVIEGAQRLRVTLYNGVNVPGDIVGTDPANDLAIIKIVPPPNTKLTTIPFGDSSKLEVGRKVLAIGNPFGLERTLTVGIVSSTGRTMQTGSGRLIKGIIQTDAAINPGNSGGPLLDSSGQMVGITTAIFSKAGQSAGLGFAIPINIAKNLVPELIAHHHIIRPDTGIEAVQQLDVGLRVMRLDPNGPAAKAGILGPKNVVYQQGGFTIQNVDSTQADVITMVDNQPVRSADDLLSYVDKLKAGQIVTLGVLRRGKLIKVPLKLTVGNAG
ncbi:MAG: glycerol-3-phosphate 1-O-acyltransferase PlsY [Candidatus Obscuribacterales bacterium]|nr:glycerol-3-phosphate 1-O-acyltransferase PlsY [Candidatus Obscuribacterales bacterium]